MASSPGGGLLASRPTKKEPAVYHPQHVRHRRVGPHGELRTRHTSMGAEKSLQCGSKMHGQDLPEEHAPGKREEMLWVTLWG